MNAAETPLSPMTAYGSSTKDNHSAQPMNITAYPHRQRLLCILWLTCLALSTAAFGQVGWASKGGFPEPAPQEPGDSAHRLFPGQSSTVCFVSMQRIDARYVRVVAWASGRRVQRVTFTTIGQIVVAGQPLGNGYWTTTVYAPRRSTSVIARTIVANRPDASAYGTTP